MYVLYFCCKELQRSYTVGIDANLCVWAYQYKNAVLVRTFRRDNIATFKEAYKFFLNSCNYCIMEQKKVNYFKKRRMTFAAGSAA